VRETLPKVGWPKVDRDFRVGAGRRKVACRVIGIVDPVRCVCALCGRGGATLWIEHRSHRDTWHEDCARTYFAAEIEPPVSDEAEGLPR